MIIENYDTMILTSKRYLKRNYTKLKISKFGVNSDIYNFNNNLIKLFKKASSTEIYNELKELNSLNTTSLVKIIKYLWIKDKFYGYSMPYIEGNMYNKIDLNTNIYKLLTSLIPLEKDLITLSKNNFVAEDLNAQNILYNENNNISKLIDLESYYKENDHSKEMIRYYNQLKLYKLFLNIISNIYKIDKTTPILYKEFNNIIYTKTSFEIGIKTFFTSLIEILENETDQEINTINDFRKSLKLSNKNY